MPLSWSARAGTATPGSPPQRARVRAAGRTCEQAVGAGPAKAGPAPRPASALPAVFIDRPLAALVHLCHGVTHDVLAC
ncbi:hypothetical protein GCM10010327_39750 [Streptomyces nitrosporeus]|nr:hypothetical protein GCM10010327_39750 [Streptomyces nitrosporeus]